MSIPGEDVIRQIEELMAFDLQLNLKPKEIVLGAAARRALKVFARQHVYSDRTLLRKSLMIRDLPVTVLPIGVDPWRVEVKSVGAEQ